MTSWMLKCERCGFRGEATKSLWCCPDCGHALAWETERLFNRSMIESSRVGLWRFQQSLPTTLDQAYSLGEVTTPLVDVDLSGFTVTCKLEYLSPSGSYKDRGAAILVAALKSLGATHAIEDSSGNAAAAISAYAAAAGLKCTVYAPAAASPGKLVQSQAYRATVERIGGSRDDVATAAMDAAAATPGATYASHNWHPFFIEGVKTWALELWEHSGCNTPDAVVVPVGSGSMLLGAHIAFSSLRNAGEIDRIPRLFAAQPAACAPVHAALESGSDDTTLFPKGATIAEGASIANPVRGKELLSAIRDSNGGAVAVSEEAIAEGLRTLASRGIYVEPTSAVAIAGAAKLIRNGTLTRGERVVVVLSGSGLKATDQIRTLLD